MGKQPLLKVALARLPAQRQEIEVIRVFQDLLRQIRLGCRQRAREVGRGLPLPEVEVTVDVVRSHRATPPVLHRLAGVPLTLHGIRHRVEQSHDMAPGQIAQHLLRDYRVGVGAGERSHVLV